MDEEELNEKEKYLNELFKIKQITLIKDKNNWWLVHGTIHIPIIFNLFIEKQIKYLTKLYEKLGYSLKIDQDFDKSY